MSDDKKLNILYVTAECIPFSANGGVADMCYALTKYLNRYENVDIKVVMPYYSNIPNQYKSQFRLVGERTVELNWRKEYCGIYEYKFNEITYYFIDNKHYFERDKLFGYDDDIERFSFFSKAVLDMFPIISFYPDVIHAHDWQCGMTCVFLKILEWQNPKYEHIKSVFSIHNLTYQGKCDFGIVKDLLNVDDKFTYLFDFYGSANITKATLLCADHVVSVSENYKREIQETDKGNGLQNVLKEIEHKFSSITNGIDYEFYNPASDPTIYENFDETTLEKRKINKLKLQEELGIEINDSKPLYCFIGYMSSVKGMDLIRQILEKYLDNGIQFVAVGGGSYEYEDYLRGINERYPNSAKITFGYNRHLAKKLYASADFLLNISSVEPCGLCPLIANKYGTLPIVFATGGLKDNFSDFKHGGNGYVLKDYNTTELCDLIDRTLHDYENKEKIENYIIAGMKENFDIADCANRYLELYYEI